MKPYWLKNRNSESSITMYTKLTIPLRTYTRILLIGKANRNSESPNTMYYTYKLMIPLHIQGYGWLVKQTGILNHQSPCTKFKDKDNLDWKSKQRTENKYINHKYLMDYYILFWPEWRHKTSVLMIQNSIVEELQTSAQFSACLILNKKCN